MKIGVRGIGVIIFYKFLSVPGVTHVVTIWRCRWHVVNMCHDVFFFSSFLLNFLTCLFSMFQCSFRHIYMFIVEKIYNVVFDELNVR